MLCIDSIDLRMNYTNTPHLNDHLYSYHTHTHTHLHQSLSNTSTLNSRTINTEWYDVMWMSQAAGTGTQADLLHDCLFALLYIYICHWFDCHCIVCVWVQNWTVNLQYKLSVNFCDYIVWYIDTISILWYCIMQYRVPIIILILYYHQLLNFLS